VTWLRPGDYIDPASAENVTVEDLPVVPCGQPHDQEVIATRDLGPGPWPGDAAINARSDKICTLEFALYIGIPDNQSRYDLYSYAPNKQSWEVGDRSVQGMVSDSRGKTTGTLRGARALRP
jgi:Septum formation